MALRLEAWAASGLLLAIKLHPQQEKGGRRQGLGCLTLNLCVPIHTLIWRLELRSFDILCLRRPDLIQYPSVPVALQMMPKPSPLRSYIGGLSMTKSPVLSSHVAAFLRGRC